MLYKRAKSTCRALTADLEGSSEADADKRSKLPMNSDIMSSVNVVSPHCMTALLVVLVLTTWKFASKDSVVMSTASASSIQFTLNKSPKQELMLL